MSDLTLWEIEDQLATLLDSLDACPDEELKPEIEAQIAEYLSREARKVDNVAAALSALETVQSSAKYEIERLRTRSQSAEKAADRLSRYVLRILHERGGKPLRGQNVTLTARRSESLVVTDPDLVPAEWKRTTVTVDIPKTPVKKALKAGQEIPGVQLREGEHLVRR